MKIFKMLNLLYEDKAYYEDVVEIFKDEVDEKTVNHLQVVLNKTLNALRVFGIKVKKEGNKFRLDSSIYSIKFTPDDLKSLSILNDSAKNFPDDEVASDLKEVIHNILLRMDSDDRTAFDNYNSNYDFSFYHASLKKQIEECKKYCKQNHPLDIVYKNKGKEIRVKCSPKDVIYDSKMAYLEVCETIKNEKIIIALNNILSMMPLPCSSSPKEATSTVVYKLKNRLAKSYKPKDNEYIRDYNEDGSIIVVNKGEAFDQLLDRLMRYSYSCEIINPKTLRNRMIELINETLDNYNE
ncbi:WYL domain-containing protein [bacterium]|nr:WYL domain-containing protein [bacterium]